MSKIKIIVFLVFCLFSVAIPKPVADTSPATSAGKLINPLTYASAIITDIAQFEASPNSASATTWNGLSIISICATASEEPKCAIIPYIKNNVSNENTKMFTMCVRGCIYQKAGYSIDIILW